MSNSSGGNGSTGGGPTGGDTLGAAEPVAGARRGRRSRVLVPASIAAVAAAGLIAVPVFAASTSLPSVTAQQLLAKVLSSHVQTFSGTVQTTVDLGIPSQVMSALPSAVAGASAGTGAAAGAAAGASAGQSKAAEQALTSLASGSHVLKVAADGPTRQLLSSSDSGAAFTLAHDGGTAWVYDGQAGTATELTGLGANDAAGSAARSAADPQQLAAQVLQALGPNTSVSVQGQSVVAGQSVYELSVKPKGSGSTIGEVRIAVDGANGMPLQVRVLPSDGSDPILDVGFTSVSFATPAASTFAFTPPSGTRVTHEAVPAHSAAPGRSAVPGHDQHSALPKVGAGSDTTVLGSGWETVYVLNAGSQAKGGSGLSGELGAVKEFGKPVAGGTLISTKLVNVLVTPKGTVYAGAVTPAVLEADAAGQ